MRRGLDLLAAVVLAAGMLFSAGGLARELTEAERGALAEAVSAFSAAIPAGDGEKVVDVVPPAVFGHLAKQHGLEVDELPASSVAQTEVVMSLEGGRKVRAASATFAILDEGRWYLIRTDDPATLAIVKSLYPTYADVEFPAGTMEAVND